MARPAPTTPAPRAVPWWLRHRFAVQVLSLVLANSFVLRHFKGFCYPVLNCWSCPGANFACPIGALQNACSDAGYIIPGAATPLQGILRAIPVYVLGTLLLFSAFFGRMMCGWLCPFGWLQEQVGRLRRSKLGVWRPLRYLRYVVLVVLVFVIPYYTHTAWFSKLCPQGALEGGLLQPLRDPSLRPMMGAWWWLKQAILAVTLAAMVFWRRPFCATVCPLGAIFSLFHRSSAWEIRWERDKCVNCLWCVRACPQGIDPRSDVNGHTCVGCLECQKCPYDAIYSAPRWSPLRGGTKAEEAAPATQ
jgi:ferredoxin-type protein NapH